MTREELNGHVDIVTECRDYLDHEAMDSGDPSGKLRDFVTSINAVLLRAERLEAVASAARDVQPQPHRALQEALDALDAGGEP